MAWQRPHPQPHPRPVPGLALAITIAVIRFALASILPAGAIKSAGKSEMKRKQGEKRNQKEVT